MTDAPALSVVIPTLGRPTLADQLGALERCRWDHPWEVLAVDNGSDGRVQATCDRWADRLPALRCIDGTGRRGRSHAVNQGAAAARGRWLLFVDDDDLVEPDIVAAVGDAFLEGARAVVFNLNLREVNPPHVWRSNAQARRTEDERPAFRGIPAIWGCAGIERELFLDLGGFDEERPYAEDLDFSVRLHEQTGIEPVWLERQLIHYRLRDTVRGRFRQRVDVAHAVRAISVEHPDTIPPTTASPGRSLLAGVARSVALLPRAASAEGRLVLADRLGELWGRFTAARRYPWPS